MIASTPIHKRDTSSSLSLCAAVIAYVRLCSYLLFCADNSTAAKCRRQNWISEPVLEQVFYMTSRCPQSIPLSQRPRRFTLALAPHYHHRCAIPPCPSPSDKILEKNGIGPWLVSGPLTWLGTLLLLRVGQARKVAVGWCGSELRRRRSSVVEGGRGGSWSRRYFAWFLWTCWSRTVAPLDRGSRQKSKWRLFM